MLKRLVFLTAIIFTLAACSSTAPAPAPPPAPTDVNPVGVWNGTTTQAGTTTQVTFTVLVGNGTTFPATWEEPGGFILPFDCQVTINDLDCTASGGGVSAVLDGTVSGSTYSGNVSVTGGGTTVAGTFSLTKN